MNPRPRIASAALVAILVAAAVGGWWITRRTDSDARRAQARAVAKPMADAISARLETDALRLVAAAQAIDGNLHRSDGELRALLPTVSTPAPIATATLEADGSVILHRLDGSAESAPPSGTDLASIPGWRTALDTARDDATPRIAGGRGPSGQETALVAAPLYGVVQVPPSVGERRRLAQGYLVVVAPATTLFGGELLDNGRGVGAELVDGPTILAASSARGRVPDLAAAAPVTAGGVTWSVYTWPTSARTPLPWVVLAIGVILAIGVALISRRVSRATEGLAQEALARAEEMGLVARTGPLLQQSLELGDLLPTFVAEVSDELDLDRVAISLMSERGQLVKMFSLGSAGSDVTESTLARTPPPTIPAGGDVIVPLQRSGRIVGAFTARAVSGLGAARMEALRAVCDLLAAAVGNVVVYQREQEMVRRLRDLDRMKTTFLGSVSHELRTMVTAIGGFAGLLASQPTPMSTERQAEYIGRIDRNATSLGLLIDDLLDFSRLERSGLSVAARPTDLSALVPAVVEQMSSLLDAHPLEVEVQPEVIAQADASAVERIIVNLLSNAAKYSPRGTPIHVELIRAADRAILSVADRGPGIPVEERSRVFDLFYRVDGPSTQAVRGVGIGLALVAELTALLDGTVIAEENPGGGALLRVSIPLAEGSHEPGANALVQHAGAT